MKRKWFVSGVALAVGISLAGCASPTSVTTPTHASIPHTTSSPKTTPASVPANDIAERTNADLLKQYGVTSFGQVLTTSPDLLAGHIASMKSPVPGDVVITLQLTQSQATKDDLDSFTRGAFLLVGKDIPDLTRLEAETADSLSHGATNRYDLPTLNQ